MMSSAKEVRHNEELGRVEVWQNGRMISTHSNHIDARAVHGLCTHCGGKADCYEDYIWFCFQCIEPATKAAKQELEMTDAQIKHMVDRFLNWKLPENFHPDGGVTFTKVGNAGTPYEYKYEPSGTNLLNATQATQMVQHMLEGLPR